jgi:hypothetical protein
VFRLGATRSRFPHMDIPDPSLHRGVLPPHRTGLADFPHPALLKTVTSGQPYERACWPSLWRRAEGFVGSADSSVIGPTAELWSKRLSFRIATMHIFSATPSLHSHYGASLLLWAAPTPATGRCWVMSSPAPLRRSPAAAPAGASQVPRLISRRALSPYTPESLVVATPVARRPVAGFSISGRLATLTCLSRPNSGFTDVTARVVTAPGLASRSPPTYGGLRPAPVWLRVERAITRWRPFTPPDQPGLSWRIRNDISSVSTNR